MSFAIQSPIASISASIAGGIRTSCAILGDEALEDFGRRAAAVLGEGGLAGGEAASTGGAGGGVEQEVGEGVLPGLRELSTAATARESFGVMGGTMVGRGDTKGIRRDGSAETERFEGERMWVGLSDGRVVGVPLAWFPRLLGAAPTEREAFSLSPFGIDWGGAGRGRVRSRAGTGGSARDALQRVGRWPTLCYKLWRSFDGFKVPSRRLYSCEARTDAIVSV